MVVPLNLLNTQLMHIRNADGCAQVRRGIARTRPVKLRNHSLIKAPRNHGVMQRELPRRIRPEDAAASWGPRPFVEIAGVPVDAQRCDVDGYGAGTVRP